MINQYAEMMPNPAISSRVAQIYHLANTICAVASQSRSVCVWLSHCCSRCCGAASTLGGPGGAMLDSNGQPVQSAGGAVMGVMPPLSSAYGCGRVAHAGATQLHPMQQMPQLGVGMNSLTIPGMSTIGSLAGMSSITSLPQLVHGVPVVGLGLMPSQFLPPLPHHMHAGGGGGSGGALNGAAGGSAPGAAAASGHMDSQGLSLHQLQTLGGTAAYFMPGVDSFMPPLEHMTSSQHDDLGSSLHTAHAQPQQSQPQQSTQPHHQLHAQHQSHQTTLQQQQSQQAAYQAQQQQQQQ